MQSTDWTSENHLLAVYFLRPSPGLPRYEALVLVAFSDTTWQVLLMSIHYAERCCVWHLVPWCWFVWLTGSCQTWIAMVHYHWMSSVQQCIWLSYVVTTLNFQTPYRQSFSRILHLLVQVPDVTLSFQGVHKYFTSDHSWHDIYQQYIYENMILLEFMCKCSMTLPSALK